MFANLLLVDPHTFPISFQEKKWYFSCNVLHLLLTNVTYFIAMFYIFYWQTWHFVDISPPMGVQARPPGRWNRLEELCIFLCILLLIKSFGIRRRALSNAQFVLDRCRRVWGRFLTDWIWYLQDNWGSREDFIALQSFNRGLSPGPRRLVLPILAPQEFQKRENVRLKWSR